MIALVIAALLAQAQAPDAAAFGQRLRDSAAAAQSLQGPLDGHWTLRDAKGRALYEIQIADPPQGSAPPEGAWQAETTRAIGPLETLSLSEGRLIIAFAPGPAQVRLHLIGAGADVWRGWMVSAAGRAAVRLTRDRDAGSTIP